MPGTPDHPITLSPAAQRWRVRFAGHVIVDSADALILKEADYPAVVYFPREDAAMAYMTRTDHRTHCPYKGDASYYTVEMDGQIVENGVWTYETPLPDMTEIAGRLAFYGTKGFEIYPVDEARVDPQGRDRPVDPARIDEIVQHTDSGDGTSQREHWPTNVEGPPREGGVR
jgi:uncharacterized protein (DUF427 family)